MRYTKPALSVEAQVDQLLTRGMVGSRDEMISRLRVINYYRLSGYWFPFRQFQSDVFWPGTSFDVVWERYRFDRQLRLIVMDALERVEICVRTCLAYQHAHTYGDPFAYAEDPLALPKLTGYERDKFLEKLRSDMRDSPEKFAEHFRAKYGNDQEYMPIWMATELMTFGGVLTLFRGSAPSVQKSIAATFGVQDRVLKSWLFTLNTVRNICAHHGRLWNRELGMKPLIPDKDSLWHQPVEIPNDRVFGALTILKYCLSRIAPQSRWPGRLQNLLDEFPSIPRVSMGFPPDWQSSPIWS